MRLPSAVLSLLAAITIPARAESVLVLDGPPAPEHVGYYAAEVGNLYHDRNIEASLVPGRSARSALQLVASGKADAAVVSADEVVLAQSNGLNVVAVFAPLQSSTRVVMVHRSSGMRRLGELEGVGLSWDEDDAVSQFLRRRLPLKNVRFLAADTTISGFLSDTTFAQLGSCLVEELLAHEAGAHPLPLYVSETGFNPYGGVLVVAGKSLKERPDWVRDLVWASQAGWARYLMHPQSAEARLRAANPKLTSTLLIQAHQELMRHTQTEDLVEISLGGMTSRRWGLLVRQMEDMSVIRRGRVDPSKVWTGRFLPR